jgi:hypothetical protein
MQLAVPMLSGLLMLSRYIIRGLLPAPPWCLCRFLTGNQFTPGVIPDWLGSFLSLSRLCVPVRRLCAHAKSVGWHARGCGGGCGSHHACPALLVCCATADTVVRAL